MGLFPKIQSPCPYRGPLSDIMDGETCRLCKKAVIDLTEMTDDGRRRFIESCEGEVCVSYKVLARPALAAAMTLMVAVPAAAEQLELTVVMVGGLRKPQSAEWIEHNTASNLPVLPVVYEDAPADKAETPPAEPATAPAGT